MNRRALIKQIASASLAGYCGLDQALAQAVVPFPIGPGAPGLPVPDPLYGTPNKFPLPSGIFVLCLAKILCEDKVRFAISIDQRSKDGSSIIQRVSVDYNGPNDTGAARGELFAAVNEPTWIVYSSPRRIAASHFIINPNDPEVIEFTAISEGGEEWYHMKMSKNQNKLNGPLLFYPPTALKADIAAIRAFGGK